MRSVASQCPAIVCQFHENLDSQWRAKFSQNEQTIGMIDPYMLLGMGSTVSMTFSSQEGLMSAHRMIHKIHKIIWILPWVCISLSMYLTVYVLCVVHRLPAYRRMCFIFIAISYTLGYTMENKEDWIELNWIHSLMLGCFSSWFASVRSSERTLSLPSPFMFISSRCR